MKPMWTAQHEQLTSAHGVKVTLNVDSRRIMFTEVLNAWTRDPDFAAFFNAQLVDSPYAAFRWETPAVTKTTVNRPFEFVLLDSPGLDRRPEPTAFAEHFSTAAGANVVSFTNLGGDATMVVPCPVADASAYAHLATFVRRAPAEQQHALWQAVGAAMLRRISDKPVWLSTAGAGVAWLHVRLDDRPKYYGYELYRSLL